MPIVPWYNCPPVALAAPTFFISHPLRCQSYLPRVASVPAIFGEAHCMNRTLACEWRQRRAGCYRAAATLSSP
jgi:hypothetical protein